MKTTLPKKGTLGITIKFVAKAEKAHELLMVCRELLIAANVEPNISFTSPMLCSSSVFPWPAAKNIVVEPAGKVMKRKGSAYFLSKKKGA